MITEEAGVPDHLANFSIQARATRNLSIESSTRWLAYADFPNSEAYRSTILRVRSREMPNRRPISA
jgi:hypothetical protein